MAERLHARHLMSRLLFVVLVVVLIYFRLMPLSTTPTRIPGPDLMLALTFCWALRRPGTVPVLLVALAFLLGDLLFQRPPGLMAALVVIATEVLRGRSRSVRGGTFVNEWLVVGGLMIAVALANRLLLVLLFLSPPPLGLDMLMLLATVLCYPLVALFSGVVLGIRRPALGEIDDRGRRL